MDLLVRAEARLTPIQLGFSYSFVIIIPRYLTELEIAPLELRNFCPSCKKKYFCFFFVQ